ncbi:beta-ketoacyl synthase N-terminal-like domain-containing protein [Streptomyces sp. NPDC002779]|uniref:beta-ketoacyl synthase N-terminal-like domain-containing protein n=1 Tax=Streptomyces sp. NPDC002779 TaxID=3364664 RepID=UPI0036BAF1A1
MPTSSVPPRSKPSSAPPPLDIAVVGIGALLPGSHTVEGFWHNVVQGRDLMSDVPASHWLIDDYYHPDPSLPDRTYARRGAFLDPVDFDPLAYGIPPKSLSATDTTQLLALVAAEQALRDATAGDLTRLDRERTGVVLGTSSLELLCEMTNRLQRPVWLKAMRDGGIPEEQAQSLCDAITGQYAPWQEATFPGLLSNVVAGRIANRFDLNGPNCTVDAACASSLAALSMAAAELQLGRCDTMLTGGVDTLNGITMYMCFSKTPALSPTGDCRPFSQDADGTMLGEGLVLFALRRLADAERDGQRVYAVLRGLGSSSDGGRGAVYAPRPQGQERALRRAYEQAGYGPSTVELVEAHGTGTKAGDLAEATALVSVLREDAPDTTSPWCAVGSVKSQMGHTKSAAGAVGLLKAVLALHHRALPPTVKVAAPQAALAAPGSPLYVNTELRPWIRGTSHPRRAAVSSFGFGGSNFHLTVEEHQPPPGVESPPRVRTVPTELILAQAGSAPALAAVARELADRDEPLETLARESQWSFTPGPYRFAVLADTPETAAQRLRELAGEIENHPGQAVSRPGRAHYAGPSTAPGRLAYLFSGQGSQYPGMGAGLALHSPLALAVWDRAADWTAEDGPAPHRAVFPPPALTDDQRREQSEHLAATDQAQPALAVQSLAQLAVLDSLGLTPDATAGHSFGELVALHAAGVFDDHTLFRLATRRGELMAAAGADHPGGMLAAGCAATRVHEILGWAFTHDDVWLVGENAPDQAVLAGDSDALLRCEQALASAGVAVTPLRTGAAFHSPAVAAAVAPFASFLDVVALRAPTCDVWSNITAARYPKDPDGIRRLLSTHITSPVRFADQIDAMYEDGIRHFVELGAGSTLTKLVGRILAGRDHRAVALDRPGPHGVTALHDAMAVLSVHLARPLAYASLWATHPPAAASPAVKDKARLTVPVAGHNYGRPYPPAPATAR